MKIKIPNLGRWFRVEPSPIVQSKDKNIFPEKINSNSLFGYFFQRIEVFLLAIMAILALNLHFAFVEYISNNAKFLESAHRFNFASRLIGSLLLVEIILALATSFFRSKNQWDKSIFTALVAFVIALFNHFTIDEIFANYLKHQIDLDIDSIRWKMILSNWLVFTIGEAIGFVMHSKGNEIHQADTAPDWFRQFAQSFTPTPTNFKPTIYNPIGEPLNQTADTAQKIEEIPSIGFKPQKSNLNNTGQTVEPISTYKSGDLSEEELREILWNNVETANGLGISIRNLQLATGKKKDDIHKRTKAAKQKGDEGQ